MPAGSVDRRVARTRNLLQQALIELTTEKGYAAVTVEDICRRADVGRSTFYTHYPDKDRLKKATIDEHMTPLRSHAASGHSQKNAPVFSFSGRVFEHAHATRELHRALMGGKKREVPEEIRDWIIALLRRELMQRLTVGSSGIELEFATRFYAGAFFEVMHWWLEQDAEVAPTEVDRMFQKLSQHGLEAVMAKQTITEQDRSAI